MHPLAVNVPHEHNHDDELEDVGSSRRMASLDGLRGIAAVVVLLNHSFVLVPSVADAFNGTEKGHGVAWWFTYTPLHVVWAGSEAVMVFFVLSGFVLTRSCEAVYSSWRAYYPSRLLRLYLPVVAALLFAAAMVMLIPRVASRTRHGY